jgi:DNA-binding beta-propeller fold protein YncE
VTLNPFGVNNVTTGFFDPVGILYDGANVWVVDQRGSPGNLLKLDSNGVIIQTVPVGQTPRNPLFDGTNIWVPNNASNSITVVRASTGTVLSTLTGNGLGGPLHVAFDGERILVTNFDGNNVSLWKASDLSPLGFTSTGSFSGPFGACSDGLNFWVTLTSGHVARL